MKKQHITLINGQRVRIEANMNVLCDFLDHLKMEYEEFLNLAEKEQVTAKQLRLMAWCCAVEGERMEGNDLNLSEMEFGALCSLKTMADFGPKLSSMIAETAEKKTTRSIPREKVRTRPIRNSIKRLLS